MRGFSHQKAALAILTAAVGAVLGPATAQADIPNQGGWQMLFADDFNGTTTANSLDPVKWNIAYPWGRTHNYPAYIKDENITVGGGTLNLQAKRESYGGQPFTSGAVNTNGLLNFHTGYVEASMKLPAFLGAWPAFWALQDGWPPELDVMEARFRSSYNGTTNSYDGYGDMYSYIGTYHWGADYTVAQSAGTGFKYPGGDLTAGFHRYGTLWASDHVEFFFDGSSQGSVYSSSANIAQMQNMYLLLNLGVGGWPGDPPGWADLSPQFQIDWVRVWQQSASGVRSNFKHNGDGNQNWDDATLWDNGAPKLGSQEAFFGNQYANTHNVRLDWNANKVVGAITFQSSINYTIGWPNDSLQMISDSGRAYINGYYQSGQGKMAIGSRLELYSNVSVRNYLNQAINLDGDIIGTGELSLENGKTVITGNGYYTGDTVVTNAGDLTVAGNISRTSNLFVQQGVATISPGGAMTTAGYSSIGKAAGDVGTLNVQGNFKVNGDLNIGDVSSRGVMNISGTGAVSATALWLGKFDTASGTVTQSGGTVGSLANPGDWRIGGGGSSADSAAVGVYNLQGGAFGTTGNLHVGAFGHGTFVQTGGTATIGAYLSIGRYAGGIGVYDMSVGGGTLNATGQPYLIVAEQGNGSLLVGGNSVVNANSLSISHNGGVGSVTQTGGTVNAPNGVVFGTNSAGGSGGYTLTGGILNTLRVYRGLGAGVFHFNGGTLRATASSTNFMQGLTNAYVDAGGANIDTSTFNLYINQALVNNGGSGGLRKFGSGLLVLNAANTYTGSTVVSLGTLMVNGTTGTGPTTIATGASLTGTGWINGPLTLAGSLNPGTTVAGNGAGSGIGTLHTYDVEIKPTSVLTMEIAGLASMDQLDVHGSLTIDPGSALTLALINGYSPHAGDSYQLWSSQSLIGTFSTINMVPLPAGMSWDISNLYSAGTVAVATPEPASLALFAVGALSLLRRRTRDSRAIDESQKIALRANGDLLG